MPRRGAIASSAACALPAYRAVCWHGTGISLPQATVAQSRLFDDLPEGFTYQDRLLTPHEEIRLLDRLSRVAFEDFEMRGKIARRRVAFFGRAYDASAVPTPP